MMGLGVRRVNLPIGVSLGLRERAESFGKFSFVKALGIAEPRIAYGKRIERAAVAGLAADHLFRQVDGLEKIGGCLLRLTQVGVEAITLDLRHFLIGSRQFEQQGRVVGSL